MKKKLTALAVHLFTAIGVLLAFWALLLISQNELQKSFYVMALAVIVNSLDGTMARQADDSIHTHFIDGALMDNMSDYLNWDKYYGGASNNRSSRAGTYCHVSNTRSRQSANKGDITAQGGVITGGEQTVMIG